MMTKAWSFKNLKSVRYQGIQKNNSYKINGLKVNLIINKMLK